MESTDLRWIDQDLPNLTKPLPPSPRSAPLLLLERQNQALRDESILLRAQIDYLRQLLEHYRQVVDATKSLIKNSFIGIKHLQDATFQMKRDERRIAMEWAEYLRGGDAIIGEVPNFF
jgi:hypothetical protein